MCIAVIKRSTNPFFSFFIGFNRDEALERRWETWRYHWKDFPDIFGLLDVDSGGTWLARNDYGVVAFLINRETSNNLETQGHLQTRARIVLEALSGAKTAATAIDQIVSVNDIRPFNFVAVDRSDVLYLTNSSNQRVGLSLNDDLIMINRSYPNDFNEMRIISSYCRFKSAREPDPSTNDYSCWKEILLETSYTTKSDNEITMFLVSNAWKTLSSCILAIRSNGDIPAIVNLI